VTGATVEATLASFAETDTTVKLIWALCEAIPGAPPLSLYRSLDEARMLVAPALDDAGLERARAWCAGPEATAAMNVADAVDTGDVGITVLTGVRTALTFFFGDKKKALDTDAQQGADAALKALALAWMASRLHAGTIPERVARFRAVPAAEVLLSWYAAVEVALPFADDALMAAGSIVGGLLDRYGGANLARLDAVAGPGASAGARAMLENLAAPLDGITRSVASRAGQIADTARVYLPPAIATAGTVAGAVATGADALPVWRLLGARLVAETALLREVTP
jgi:hypothetical protein